MKKTLIIFMIITFVAVVISSAAASTSYEHGQLIKRYGSVDETMWENITKANRRMIDEDFYEHLRSIYFRILMDAETKAKKAGTRREIPHSAYFYANLADYVGNVIKKPSDMRLKLARANMMDKRFDTAVQIMNIIKVQEPKNVKVREELAEVFVRLKMLKEAMDIYEEILKIDKKNKVALFRLGMLYNSLGRHRMAEKMFKDLLKIDPENTVAKRFVDLYEGKIQSSGVKKINEKAIQHFINGERLFAGEKFEAAAEEYAKAVEADPRFARAYTYLGECLTRMKKYNEAVDVLRHSITVDPKDSESYYFLGQALEKQFNFSQDRKHLDEALANYRKASEMDPKNKKYRQDLERVRKRMSKVSG